MLARAVLARATVVLLVTATGGGLTGCGGGEPVRAQDVSASASASSPARASNLSGDPSSTRSGTPSGPTSTDGELVGKGYTLALPDGWQDATAQFQEYSPLIDAGALNADQAGEPFSDNVNVLRNADQTELPPSQAERQFAQELGTVATRVRVEDRTTIDGVRALHLTGRTKAGEVVALTDQYVCFVDGAYYVATFSYGSTTPAARRTEEVAGMLASWNWA